LKGFVLLILFQLSGEVWVQIWILANTKTGTVLVNIVSSYNDMKMGVNLLSETVCVQNIQPISKNFQNIIDKLSS
jgi:hypothetical protein